MIKFPANVNTPTERALNFLSYGVFTFSGNLVILKLLAIFELPYRLARPKLLFSCPQTSGARALHEFGLS